MTCSSSSVGISFSSSISAKPVPSYRKTHVSGCGAPLRSCVRTVSGRCCGWSAISRTLRWAMSDANMKKSVKKITEMNM
ncbi:hypothetical protein [uncultured Alistipes sp.]|uniref:hypothetical protein n=1 Tax=uncultured Alistipes sp. TaxID=538949 RepID=UPI002665C0BD|nr:hypothetical protein [uncultured Alistipes sp.]